MVSDITFMDMESLLDYADKAAAFEEMVVIKWGKRGYYVVTPISKEELESMVAQLDQPNSTVLQ